MQYQTILLVFLILFRNVTANDDYSAKKKQIDSINALPHEFLVSNLYQSINIYSKNAFESESIGYKYGAGQAYAQLGRAYYLNGKYEQSTASYLRAIKIFERANTPDLLADTYGEYGYQLKRTDMQKANYFMRAGISIAERGHPGAITAKLYDNYGVLKEMENQPDSAMLYYEKALKIKTALNDSIGIPFSLNKISGVYLIKNDFSKALSFLRQSDSFRAREKSEFGRAENLILYGDIYLKMGRADSAASKYQRALHLALKVGMNYSIRYCYEQLTEIYRQKGDYKRAYESHSRLSVYKDSTLNKEVRVNMAQLQLAYDLEKKDREIAVSRLELSQRLTQIYLLVAATLMIIISSVYFYYRQKREREREKKEMFLNNKLKQSEVENRIANEKLRISRELHDNIGSLLTLIISSLENYSYRERNGQTAEKYSKLSTLGREALKELRNAIWALRHDDSELNELILRINEFTRAINESTTFTVSVISRVHKSIRLTSVQMLNIYRIVQEALQNTMKYANACSAEIVFEESAGKLVLSIRDDGTGFNVKEAGSGNGLRNMKFRCLDSNGEFEIISTEKGTGIKCTFCLN